MSMPAFCLWPFWASSVRKVGLYPVVVSIGSLYTWLWHMNVHLERTQWSGLLTSLGCFPSLNQNYSQQKCDLSGRWRTYLLSICMWRWRDNFYTQFLLSYAVRWNIDLLAKYISLCFAYHVFICFFHFIVQWRHRLLLSMCWKILCMQQIWTAFKLLKPFTEWAWLIFNLYLVLANPKAMTFNGVDTVDTEYHDGFTRNPPPKPAMWAVAFDLWFVTTLPNFRL